jgi:hypothetical protein
VKKKKSTPLDVYFVFESQTSQDTDCYSWLDYGDKKCLCRLEAT